MSDYLIAGLSSGLTSSLSTSIDNLGSALGSSMNNMQALSVSAINRGAAAAQAKNYDLAVKEFKRATAYDPNNTDIYSYLGQVYTMMGQLPDAVTSYKRGLQIDPANDDMRNQLAMAYVQQHDYNNAEKELLQLAKTNPENPGPPTTLGNIYLQQGRLAEADTQFTKAVRMAPTDTTAYVNLGLVRNQQGNYADAARQFERALSLDPTNSNAMANLAYADMGLGDPDSAKVMYRQLMAQGTSAAATLASQVQHAINTPKIQYVDPAQSNFLSLVGAGTSVSTLDPSLATAGASKVFKLTFVFNGPMDPSSVMNPLNWTITKATGGSAGLYDNGLLGSDTHDVNVPVAPLSVTYDSNTNTATVYFRVTQNATGDGTIDPSHLLFTFSGKDATGRSMDKTGNQYDGSHITPF